MNRDEKFVQVFRGICPNTGELCEKLGDLRYALKISRESFRENFGKGSYENMTPEQQAAYDRKSQEQRQMDELATIVVAGQCLGGCALADIDVIAYVSGEHPAQGTETPPPTPPGNPPFGFPPTYCIP